MLFSYVRAKINFQTLRTLTLLLLSINHCSLISRNSSFGCWQRRQCSKFTPFTGRARPVVHDGLQFWYRANAAVTTEDHPPVHRAPLSPHIATVRDNYAYTHTTKYTHTRALHVHTLPLFSRTVSGAERARASATQTATADASPPLGVLFGPRRPPPSLRHAHARHVRSRETTQHPSHDSRPCAIATVDADDIWVLVSSTARTVRRSERLASLYKTNPIRFLGRVSVRPTSGTPRPAPGDYDVQSQLPPSAASFDSSNKGESLPLDVCPSVLMYRDHKRRKNKPT